MKLNKKISFLLVFFALLNFHRLELQFIEEEKSKVSIWMKNGFKFLNGILFSKFHKFAPQNKKAKKKLTKHKK